MATNGAVATNGSISVEWKMEPTVSALPTLDDEGAPIVAATERGPPFCDRGSRIVKQIATLLGEFWIILRLRSGSVR